MKWVKYFLVLTLLLIVGCQGGGDTQPATSDPRVGSDGLVLSITPGLPPSFITLGDPFSIQFEIDNLGAYPQAPRDGTLQDDPFRGCVYLQGFSPSMLFQSSTGPCFSTNPYIQGHTANIPSTLYGKDQYNRRGTSDVVTFTGSYDSLPRDDAEYTQRFQATACYQYQTTALPTICVDPDPFDATGGREVCDVNVVENLHAGQGGPVAITYIRPQAGAREIRFEIGIANQGNGVLISPPFRGTDSDFGGCPNPPLTDLDWVHLDVEVDGTKLDCRPGVAVSDGQYRLRLQDGTGVLTCFLNIGNLYGPIDSAFQTPMEITINYNYQTTLQSQLRVVPN